MKTCLECGTELFGRVDKKFCCDSCRNTHNNRENAVTNNLVRNINRQLGKNRRILAELRRHGKEKITRETLIGKGFSFELMTSIGSSQSGNNNYYCYDLGYREIDRGELVLVEKKCHLL